MHQEGTFALTDLAGFSLWYIVCSDVVSYYRGNLEEKPSLWYLNYLTKHKQNFIHMLLNNFIWITKVNFYNKIFLTTGYWSGPNSVVLKPQKDKSSWRSVWMPPCWCPVPFCALLCRFCCVFTGPAAPCFSSLLTLISLPWDCTVPTGLCPAWTALLPTTFSSKSDF